MTQVVEFLNKLFYRRDKEKIQSILSNLNT